MVEENFSLVYKDLRLCYYKKMFKLINRPKEGINANEVYWLESAYLLGRPTISEYADFLGVSLANANYKINKLVKKGFIIKELSTTDKRETYIVVSEKFTKPYLSDTSCMIEFINDVRKELTKKELNEFNEYMLRLIKRREKINEN